LAHANAQTAPVSGNALPFFDHGRRWILPGAFIVLEEHFLLCCETIQLLPNERALTQ
jgi:hypothetical protein